jgi:molybdate transport system substrate-binding protein
MEESILCTRLHKTAVSGRKAAVPLMQIAAEPLRLFGFGLALALAHAGAADAAEAKVAVAANFAAPMAHIAEAFQAASGHTLKLSTGATGKFHAQIVAGAPFDVLLAADAATPARLVASGHAVAGSRFTYAVGRLVLWSAEPGRVDDQGMVLARGSFAHLAIANPRTAPYGAAAMQVLRARGLAEALASRLVIGESIAQAYQFVATGSAELGFVAASQVSTPERAGRGSFWRVPPGLHDEIRQDAVLLRVGAGNAAALALLDYLKGDAARATLRAYGYGP